MFQVELHRNGRNGTMVIDGGAEVVSGLSPGSFTSLNVETEMLFVGGTPLVLPPTNLISFREEVGRNTEQTPVPPLPPSLSRSLQALWVASFLSLSTASSLTSVLLRPAVALKTAEISTQMSPLSTAQDTYSFVRHT